MDNLRVHVQFSHIHPSRGQMGLLRRRATDYFVVLLGCLVKAPMGYKMRGHRRGEDEKKGGGKKDGDHCGEEKKGQEKPEASREKMRGESNIAQKPLVWCGVLNTFIPLFDHTKTTGLVI